MGIILQGAFAGHAHGGQFFHPAKPAEKWALGQPPAHPAIILAQQAFEDIAAQGAVTVLLMALPGLGFGGGKLLVVTRKALLDEIFFHAAPEQELVDAAQWLLEVPVIDIA